MYNEIEYLRKEARNGDKRACEKLLVKLKPLIINSIRRYYNDYSLYDDLIQDGFETIIRCVKDFNESRGVNFLGYVKVELKFLYLNKHKEKKTFSLNETVGEDGVELIDLLEDNKLDPLENYLELEEKEFVMEALSILTKRQREVMVLYYLQENSIGEIANMLGISYRTVVNIKVNALKKLKSYVI